jgi:two-component sensor histidine kinase
LSVDGGKVAVSWRVVRGGAAPTFEFGWTESGGPAVTKPKRKGFGSRMVQQALPGYFNGTAELDYAPAGLAFSLVTPLTGLTL